MKEPKEKKRSIREFVSEEELLFQIYLLKYSQQLRDIKSKTKKEIQDNHKSNIEKRTQSLEKALIKYTRDNDSIAIQSILMNIEYIKSIEAPISISKIHEQFEERKAVLKEYIETRLLESHTEYFEHLKIYIENLELNESASKERFGEMLLLMIKNLATMPSFGGYTENWKTDFFSNAIEKTLLYMHNFDENLLSKRTGNKSKAFAYITQICFNAFVNIINLRKEESEFIKDSIEYNSATVDGVRNQIVLESKGIEEEDSTITIPYEQDINTLVKNMIEKIEESNIIFIENKALRKEIEDLEANTLNKDKDKDYISYIEELKEGIKEEIYDKDIKTLKIIKENSQEIFNLNPIKTDINIVITVKPNIKIKEVKKDLKLEEIDYFEEFYDID